MINQRKHQKNFLKLKLQRRLTYKKQENKVCKNQWPLIKSNFIVKSLGFGILDKKKIEVCRVILRRAISTKDTRNLPETKIHINAHMNRVFTKKSSNQRMGKGKGSIKGRFSTVYPGKVLFELKIGTPEKLLPAFKALKDRLPFKIFLASHDNGYY